MSKGFFELMVYKLGSKAEVRDKVEPKCHEQFFMHAYDLPLEKRILPADKPIVLLVFVTYL